ncbi:MAG: hypothetical protein ACOY16_06135 [Chloroflexota bacterium]
MRAIHTFILRLIVDSAEPLTLRGNLQPMPEGEAQPFAGEIDLLAILRAFLSQERHSQASDADHSKHDNQQGSCEKETS